jgi:branched-chain amino acid transport system ATP-binding protein
MTSVLEVRNVTVRFGGVTAVEGASLTIADGQLIGFIGPNGAGKTTLMRVITGIVKPTDGDVLLMGEDITGWPINVRVQAGLAFAQQIVQPLNAMTLLDNVALACGAAKTRNPLRAMLKVDRGPESARARELLGMVGLADVADRFPATLPLGYRKRLEMARAMALEPKLLLLDEPLAGLNQAEANALASLIRDLNAGGQTILLIEHNLREVMRICPLLYVQDRGRPLAFGKTAEVMADPTVRQAYLGGHA